MLAALEGLPLYRQMPSPFNKLPAFGQHPVGGQLRRGGKVGVNRFLCRLPGTGFLRTDFHTGCTCEGFRKALWYGPEAVVQGQALAHVNNPPGVVDTQIESFEYLDNLGTVLRNYSPLQPFQQSRITQFHFQWEPAAFHLVDFMNLGFQTLDTMLGQGERQ